MSFSNQPSKIKSPHQFHIQSTISSSLQVRSSLSFQLWSAGVGHVQPESALCQHHDFQILCLGVLCCSGCSQGTKHPWNNVILFNWKTQTKTKNFPSIFFWEFRDIHHIYIGFRQAANLLRFEFIFFNPWVQPVCYAYCFLQECKFKSEKPSSSWQEILVLWNCCFGSVAHPSWLPERKWPMNHTLRKLEDLRGNFLRSLIIYSNVRYLSSILPFFTMTLLGHILHNRHGGSSFWHRLVMTSASSVLLLSFGFVSEHETTRNRAIVPSTKWTGGVCTVKEDVPNTYVFNSVGCNLCLLPFTKPTSTMIQLDVLWLQKYIRIELSKWTPIQTHQKVPLRTKDATLFWWSH